MPFGQAWWLGWDEVSGGCQRWVPAPEEGRSVRGRAWRVWKTNLQSKHIKLKFQRLMRNLPHLVYLCLHEALWSAILSLKRGLLKAKEEEVKSVKISFLERCPSSSTHMKTTCTQGKPAQFQTSWQCCAFCPCLSTGCLPYPSTGLNGVRHAQASSHYCQLAQNRQGHSQPRAHRPLQGELQHRLACFQRD